MKLYKSFCENLILPVFDLINGGNLAQNFKIWRKIDKFSKVEINNLRDINIHKLLLHAKTNLPFYKNIDYDTNSSALVALKKFPTINKIIIRENIDKLVFGEKENYIKEASSGSSGVQGIVYLDKVAQSMHRSIQMHWWEWGGYEIGKKILQTGITPNRGFIKSIKDLLFRTHYFPAYSLEESEVAALLLKANSIGYKHFMGYASSLYVLASVAQKNNITNIKLDSVVSWGDKMFPHFRDLIEKQFNTKVFDTYACTEGAMIAAQCKEGSYHLMSPQTHLEVLDDDGNDVQPGQLGKVYVTRLDNFAMPLIRYYLGDLAELEDPEKNCTCGMNYPLLKRVIGRDTDIVKTKSNKFMVVHSFTGIFEHIPEVIQFRVIQKSLDYIDIEIIPAPDYNPNIEISILSKIQSFLKEDFKVNFILVDSIPNTASGKPQLIQSFLNQSLQVQ